MLAFVARVAPSAAVIESDSMSPALAQRNRYKSPFAHMSIAYYALLCLVLPQLWALFVAWICRRSERREALRRSKDGKSPEYMI